MLRRAAILFLAITCVAAKSSGNSTELPAVDSDAKNDTYPYASGRSMNYNPNPPNQFSNNPRFLDLPNPAPGSNLFNTSLAFTIPLFTINTRALTLNGGKAFPFEDDSRSSGGYGRSFFEPAFEASGYGSGVGTAPLGSGVVAGLAIPAFIAGILILLFDIFSRPFLPGAPAATGRATDSIFSGGFGGIAEYLLTFVENSLDHVPTIDGEECIKRSVCEAHSNPKKYGIIALPLQLLFPPYPYSGTDDTSKISKYQLAARYGKTDNANCGAQYHGCVINPLDIISSFARMITDI